MIRTTCTRSICWYVMAVENLQGKNPVEGHEKTALNLFSTVSSQFVKLSDFLFMASQSHRPICEDLRVENE